MVNYWLECRMHKKTSFPKQAIAKDYDSPQGKAYSMREKLLSHGFWVALKMQCIQFKYRTKIHIMLNNCVLKY